MLADVEQIVRLGIRLIKVHPPHQLLYPNDYLHGVKESRDSLPRRGGEWHSCDDPHRNVGVSERPQ
jgi:hypothetical protein